MAEFINDCPRCLAKRVTFSVMSHTVVEVNGWQNRIEAFCICRHCKLSSTFLLYEKDVRTLNQIVEAGGFAKINLSINHLFNDQGHVSLKDRASVIAPEHLPAPIKEVFDEGAKCMAVGCFNAGGTMFRLCLDMATKSFMPETNDNGLNSKVRRSLGLRLDWLFDTHVLPRGLEELAACVKEDGNDGAHEGTLTKTDAEDLLDFTVALLERLYTEPATLKLAQERRAARRQADTQK